MKQEKIYAIVKQPGGEAVIKLLDREPKTFNAVVEGKKEIIPFPGMAGVCVVFGEGADKRKPNFYLPEYGDLMTGTVVIGGIDFERGFQSLTEEQAGLLEEYLNRNDAKDFKGNVGEKIAAGYLALSEENYLFGLLSEVKTKYKAVKIKWLTKR